MCMTRKLFILFFVVLATTASADEARQLYLCGNAPFGMGGDSDGWRSEVRAMNLAADGVYTYEVTSEAEKWFSVTDNGDLWADANHRWGFGGTIPSAGTIQLVKGTDQTIHLPAGHYFFSIDSKTMKMTIGQITFYVENDNPTAWTQLALYGYKSGVADTDLYGGWPGTTLYDGSALTNDAKVTVTKEGNLYTVTLKNPTEGVNYILSNNNGKQTDLSGFAHGKTFTLPAYTSFRLINEAEWSDVYIHAYTGETPLYGTWPGAKLVNSNTPVSNDREKGIRVRKIGKTDAEKDVYEVAIPDNSTGFQNFIINNYADSQTGSASGYLHGKTYKTIADSNEDPATEAPTITKQTFTIGANNYATAVTLFDIDFDGQTFAAYKASKQGENIRLTKVSSATAGTPLILKGDAGEYHLETGTASEVTENILQAATSYIVGVGGSSETHYVLGISGENAGFGKLAAGAILDQGKAYIPSSALSGSLSAPRYSITFGDGQTTGINTVLGSEGAVNDYYNLAGQRVAKPTKGLYIVNGKKYAVK